MATLAAQHAMVRASLGRAPGNDASAGSPDERNRHGAVVGATATSNVDEGAGRRAAVGRPGRSAHASARC